jgi:glycosyltransferase involved in cell wall biosynthesis
MMGSNRLPGHTDEEKLTLSFIMTALNEEENVRAAINDSLKAMDDYGIGGEVMVVNDGSTDRTEEIVDEMMQRDARVRTLRHETPQGVGASFWDGVDEAAGDVVCWIPGDNENDPWEILRYFDLLGHVDIVIPFVFNKHVRSLFRNVLSFIYRFIINTTFVVYFNYTNGTVLYRKAILKELEYRSRGFFFQTDILVRVARRGYLFAEIPYRLGMRSTGASKAVSFPSLMKVARGYLRLVKDIYFSKEGKLPRKFDEGSLTARRYKDGS